MLRIFATVVAVLLLQTSDKNCFCVQRLRNIEFRAQRSSQILPVTMDLKRREESCYASMAKPHRFHKSTPLLTESSNAGRCDWRCALGMRPRTRASVHFVTHSCIFRSERFATRASLSRTTCCYTSKSAQVFRRYTRTVASREICPILPDRLQLYVHKDRISDFWNYFTAIRSILTTIS